jgi:ABC-type glutathione transport system ATPase component
MSAVEPLAPAADVGGPGQPLLQVRGLSKQFPVRGGLRTRAGVVRAVDGVSFTVNKREVMGVVGESGCGKSTMARLVIGLIAPDKGDIVFDGEAVGDVLSLRDLRRRVQMVFQDSYASLNPRLTIEDTISFGPRVHDLAPNQARDARTIFCARSASIRRCSRRAIRTSFPEGSGSASTLHARSRSRRGSCCSTRRSRHWTSRWRRRSSIFFSSSRRIWT